MVLAGWAESLILKQRGYIFSQPKLAMSKGLHAIVS
jgi:hypothetical protein